VVQGIIGQDTLSFMIRQDEMAPARSRRRSIYFNYYGSDTTGKLGYPQGDDPCAYAITDIHNAAQIPFRSVDGSKNDIMLEVQWPLRS
jgi:hypothetical protein